MTTSLHHTGTDDSRLKSLDVHLWAPRWRRPRLQVRRLPWRHGHDWRVVTAALGPLAFTASWAIRGTETNGGKELST